MRFRTTALALGTALVITACATASDGVTTTTPAPTTTTEAESGIPEPVLLSYKLEAGTTFEYEVALGINIELTSSGDTAAFSNGDDMPGEAQIALSGTSHFTHTVADGPEPGTFEVAITGDFSDLTLTGTIDGEPVDPSETPDFAAIPPVDTTVIVDEQGNVIEAGDDMDDLFGDGDFGDLGNFGSPGSDLGRFIGPPFPEREVTVGAIWEKTIERTNFFTDPITTDVVSEVTGYDTEACPGEFEIETVSVTSAIDVDFGEILVGFFEAFVPEGATDEELAEIEALKEQLQFRLALAETTENLDTCFDAVAGMANSATYTGGADLIVDINMPDEVTGELTAFAMEMSFSQEVTYRLVGDSGA